MVCVLSTCSDALRVGDNYWKYRSQAEKGSTHNNNRNQATQGDYGTLNSQYVNNIRETSQYKVQQDDKNRLRVKTDIFLIPIDKYVLLKTKRKQLINGNFVHSLKNVDMLL